MESPIELGLAADHMENLSYLDRVATMNALPGATEANILLNVLQGLHIFWFYLLLRILYKIASGVETHKIGQEEYEGQSTDNDE